MNSKIFKKEISVVYLWIVNVACIKSELFLQTIESVFFLEFKTDGGTEEECTWIKTRLMYRKKKSCSSFWKSKKGGEEDKRGKNASDKFADAATFMRCQLEMNYYFVCTEKPYVHIVF